MMQENRQQKITPGRVLQILDFLYSELEEGENDSSVRALAEYFQKEKERTGQDFWKISLKKNPSVSGMPDMAVSKQLWAALSLSAVCAYLSGADLKQETVKSAVFLALLGKKAPEVLEDLFLTESGGMKLAFGWDCANAAVSHFSHDQVVQIRQTVGIRLSDSIRSAQQNPWSAVLGVRKSKEEIKRNIENIAWHLFRNT